MWWGPQSRQYLTVVKGREYYSIGDDSDPNSWWYMVPYLAQGRARELGGWAPPSKFRSQHHKVSLWEVEEPDFTPCDGDVPLPCVPRGGLGACAVHVYGINVYGQGMVGAWVFQGHHGGGCVSMSGDFPGICSADLLALYFGLALVRDRPSRFNEIVIRMHSPQTYRYVFQNDNQYDHPRMRDYLPGITLLRMYLDCLERDPECIIHYQDTPRQDNFAASIACTEARYRGSGDLWAQERDRWPAWMDLKWFDPFIMISDNTCSNQDQKEYYLPSELLEELLLM